MSYEMFNFRDRKELRSPWRSLRNGLVGTLSVGVVFGSALVAKGTIQELKTKHLFQTASTTLVEECNNGKPVTSIQLPRSGDAVVQVTEMYDGKNQSKKLGLLCVRLASTDDSRGKFRQMSISVKPKGTTSLESLGDSGVYSRYTDWVVVEPNNQAEVVAVVEVPDRNPVTPDSVSVGFELLYPADNISGEMFYRDPVVSGVRDF